MVGLSLTMGAIMLTSSWNLRYQYLAYERNRELFDLATTLSQTFEKMRRALDGYLIGSETEKDRFNVLDSEIDRILNRWKNMRLYAVEKDEQRKYENRLRSLRQGLEQVFHLADAGRRTDAIQIMDSTFFAVMDVIQKDLKSLALSKKIQSDEYWKSTKSLVKFTTYFSIILLLSVILTGVGFSIMLYQSISHPLAKLHDGAQKIGAGDWNLKLDIERPKELADLARKLEEMAQSLSLYEAQVVQMERMSSLGTLAGGVAHEINNPLTGVLGQAQLLMEKMSPDDPNLKNVQKIETAAQRCRKIVRGLLDFSRPTSYAFQSVHVDDIIQSVLALCDTEMNALGVRLIWNQNQSLPKILASVSHLQQVFLNIITNAIHAMPKGGTLMIETRTHQAENGNHSEKRSSKNNQKNPRKEFVEVTISDTGIGIHPDHLPHVFEPFFTTKEPGKGTGLGLSITYGIIQQHQGQIEVKSEGLGKGSTFVIRFPISPLASEQSGSGVEIQPAPRFG